MKIFYQFFSFLRQLDIYVKVKVFQRRFFLLRITGNRVETIKRNENILVVIAHVVPNPKSATSEKLDRFVACLDALCKSLNAMHSKIIILTKENFSLHESLPEYLKYKTEVYFSNQQDPMFVEYDAYDVFKQYVNQYDYFLFLEDDILLNDSWFLEKIKKFNRCSPKKNYVLLPHRFEYFNGLKHYFDQSSMENNILKPRKYSEHLKIVSDDVMFTIFENPHAAFYCLNKEQMLLWIKSGYKWKNKVVAFGILESAVTFSMYENFEFFNPHPENISYLEVQHYGNKYILQHRLLNDYQCNTLKS